MKFQFVRNATFQLEYGGVKFLVDPMLGKAGSLPSYHERHKGELNPCKDLPDHLHLEDIIDVDAVIVTHLHGDHFDKKAAEVLNKELPVYC